MIGGQEDPMTDAVKMFQVFFKDFIRRIVKYIYIHF